MKNIINFRPIFFCFVAFGLGIYFARPIFALNPYVVLFISVIILLGFWLSIKFKCFYRLISVIAAFMLGVGVFCLSFYTFNHIGQDLNKQCFVSGRISTVKDYTYSQSVILDNLYINGERVNNNIIVHVEFANSLEVGYVITFKATIEKTSLFSLGEFNNYYYKYSIAYSSSIEEVNVTIDRFDGLTISESLRNSIKLKLQENMSHDEVSICYASLFGDKTLVDYDIKENFLTSGLAHLLAVSGLHIGFIAAAISKLLNKLKLKRYINLIIISIILLFYCYLCSFSVSVVRATIMCIVLLIANMLGKHYDRLNALGLAGIIVLLYKPLSVFDPGFLLSFFCVFSINMFLPILTNWLSKFKLNKKISNSLALILSVQLGLLPLTIYYYGKISILTILANFICVPIFEIFFILLLFCVACCMIIFPLGFILKAPALIINLLIKFAEIIALQNWSIIPLGFIAPFLIVVMYFVMFILSHYINLKFKMKLSIVSCMLIFSCVMLFANNLPVNNLSQISLIKTYNQTTYVLELDNNVICVGKFNYNSIKNNSKYLNNIAHKKCDYLLCMDNVLSVDSSLYKSNFCFAVNKDDKTLAFNEEYVFGNVKINAVSYDGELNFIHLKYNHNDFIFCNDTCRFEQLYTYLNIEDNVEYIFCNSGTFNNNFDNINANNIILNGNRVYSNKSYQKQMLGAWTMEVNNDKITKIRSID